MTKKLKKSLATLLAMSMILSMASVSAFAANEGDELENNEPVIEDVVTEGENNENTPGICETCGKETCVCGEGEEKPEENLCEHEWNEGETVEGGTKYTCALCGESHVLENEDNSFDTDTLEEPVAEMIEPEVTEVQKLQAAIEAAPENAETTFTLEQDMTIESWDNDRIKLLDGRKKIILDLNGHNVTVTFERTAAFLIKEGCKLTIKDSANRGTISQPRIGSNFAMVSVSGGEFALESGTLTVGGTSAGSHGAAVQVINGKADINGGTIIAAGESTIGVVGKGSDTNLKTVNIGKATIEASGKSARAVSLNGNAATITITGATLLATGESAKCAEVGNDSAAGSKMTITDSTLQGTGDGTYGVYGGYPGSVEVTGCTIEAKGYGIYGWKAAVKVSETDVTVDGNAQTYAVFLHDSANNVVTIESGEFTGNIEGKDGNLSISGGTFTVDVTPYVAESYAQNAEGKVLPADEVAVPMGSVAKVGGRGYITLTEAFAAVAAATDKTITLLADVDFTKECTAAVAVDVSGVTIDLNGKTVTTGYISDAPLLTLLGDFTLKNGKVQAKGDYGIFTNNVAGAVDPSKVAKIEDVEVLGGGVNAGSKVELTNVTATGNTYYAVWSEGDVTIKSGTYSSNGNAVLGVSGNHGSMTVEGGTFTAKENQSMVLGNNYGKPLIKGGTFNKDMTGENITLAEGLQWKENNGTWTVEEKPVPVEKAVKIMGYDGALASYETLQEAINDYSAFENVWMIVYDKPLTESVTVKNGQNVTISLNHTLTNEEGKDTITVENGGWLTLYFNSDNPEYVVELVNNSTGHAAVNNAGTVDFPYNARVKGEYALKNNGGTVRLQGRFEGQIETGKPADDAEKIDIGNWKAPYSAVPVGAVMAGNGAMVTDPDENIIIKQSSDQWCNTLEEGWYKCAAPKASINGVKYDNLQELINSATEPTEITLESNVEGVTIPEGKTITLNLNGKQIKGAKRVVALTNHGTLTIQGEGTVQPYANNNNDKNTVENSGTLTIKGGKFTYRGKDTAGLLSNSGSGKIIVEGGTFSEAVKLAHCAEGYLPIANGDGTYGVTNETLTITPNRTNQTGAGAVTLTVAPANLSAEVAVTCDVDGITLTDNRDGTWTTSRLPNRTVTYTFTVTVGTKTATCTVSVSYDAPYVPPVTEPDEDLGDEDTPLSERPWLFVDVKEGDYFYDAVKRLFDKGIVGGTTETTYEPYADATRGMVAQILYGMAGSPDVTGLEMPFSDVKESDFYYNAVIWAYANKVIGGYPEDNTFRGENTITREELAAVLHQYGVEKLGLADTKGGLDGFIDADKISGWAVGHMEWAVGMEIMHGDTAKKLMPQELTIRADMTIMLNNLDLLVSDEK